MRFDAIKQFAKLRQQLLEEKTRLEERLREINQVLQVENAPSSETATPSPVQEPQMDRPQPTRRGRRKRGSLSQRDAIMQALRERGPLTRKELAAAIQELGYISKAKDPLNSMGIVLYDKNSPFKKKDGKFYLPSGTSAETNNVASPQKGKRVMSEEGKARISAAQKARWERARKATRA